MGAAVEGNTDTRWMGYALALAETAGQRDEVPVGAVLVRDDRVLGEGFNSPIALDDPTAHAEILAIRQAARAESNYRLPGTTLYVTLEPCPMCAGAILMARIARVVFGAFDDKSGAAGSVVNLLNRPSFNHHCLVSGGVLRGPCADLLTDFFQTRRNRAPTNAVC